MKQRNSEHFPERNIYKHTTAGVETFTPDLNLANVFRVVSSAGALTVANPVNARDGQYIRIEVTSVGRNVINFGTSYLVNGAVIADGTHTGDRIVVYEGFYDADAGKFNVVKLVDKAGSAETDILTFVLDEQTGAATINATAHTVAIEVEAGTTVTALTPTVTVSEGASVSPLSGAATDFTSPVNYTVTAEDGTTQVWAVTVTVAS